MNGCKNLTIQSFLQKTTKWRKYFEGCVFCVFGGCHAKLMAIFTIQIHSSSLVIKSCLEQIVQSTGINGAPRWLIISLIFNQPQWSVGILLDTEFFTNESKHSIKNCSQSMAKVNSISITCKCLIQKCLFNSPIHRLHKWWWQPAWKIIKWVFMISIMRRELLMDVNNITDNKFIFCQLSIPVHLPGHSNSNHNHYNKIKFILLINYFDTKLTWKI